MTKIISFPGFSRLFLGKRNGSQQQMIDYCKKGEQPKAEFQELGRDGPNWGKNAQFYEFGSPTLTTKGQRTDIQWVVRAVQEGNSDMEIAQKDFRIFNNSLRGIDRLRMYVKPTRDESRKIILHVGDPGTGKTRRAYLDHPELFEAPIPVGKSQWYDGYFNQQVVLFDEFEGHMPMDHLLKLSDNFYVRSVGVKTSHAWFNPSIVYFTSNTEPWKWYKSWHDRKIKELAFRRRFTKVVHFKDGQIIEYNTQDEIRQWWQCESDYATESVNSRLMAHSVDKRFKSIDLTIPTYVAPRSDESTAVMKDCNGCPTRIAKNFIYCPYCGSCQNY